MRDEARALTRGCRTQAAFRRPRQLPNTSDAQHRQKGYPENAVLFSGTRRALISHGEAVLVEKTADSSLKKEKLARIDAAFAPILL